MAIALATGLPGALIFIGIASLFSFDANLLACVVVGGASAFMGVAICAAVMMASR